MLRVCMCGAAGARAARGGTFSPGEGSIHMDNVACTGEEGSIFDCSRTANLNCRHFEDAGVFCEGQLWFFSFYIVLVYSVYFPVFFFSVSNCFWFLCCTLASAQQQNSLLYIQMELLQLTIVKRKIS